MKLRNWFEWIDLMALIWMIVEMKPQLHPLGQIYYNFPYYVHEYETTSPTIWGLSYMITRLFV